MPKLIFFVDTAYNLAHLRFVFANNNFFWD